MSEKLVSRLSICQITSQDQLEIFTDEQMNYHSFYAFVVHNIVCITSIEERPDPSVDHLLQVLFFCPHPVTRLSEVIVHIHISFLPCGFGTDMCFNTIEVVSEIGRIEVRVL